MSRKARKSTRATAILDRLTGDDTEMRQRIERERVNAEVAQLIYDMRTQAGLTQRELASRLRTQQSTIARLEDADYRGHSLTMLARIAAVLDMRVEISAKPARASAA